MSLSIYAHCSVLVFVNCKKVLVKTLKRVYYTIEHFLVFVCTLFGLTAHKILSPADGGQKGKKNETYNLYADIVDGDLWIVEKNKALLA